MTAPRDPLPPRKRTLPKNRTMPYRALALLLYARHPWIARRLAEDGLTVEVRFLASPLRMALGVTNRDRLYSYLSWLEVRGLAVDVRPDRSGRVQCRVPVSAGWNEWDFPGWALKNGTLPGTRPTSSWHHLLTTAAEELTERQTMAGELVAVDRRRA